MTGTGSPADGTRDLDAHHRAFYDAEVAERSVRPLGEDRERAVATFAGWLRVETAGVVLEVGSGAGRDATVLAATGCRYLGIDLAGRTAAWVRARGLAAVQASALRLPLHDRSVGAVWSMSTLMHLPGNGLEGALAEIRRVLRPGGLVGLGLWGHDVDGEWVDRHGRYFRHRTDDGVRRHLTDVGDLVTFETWDRFPDGGHYQWAVART